MRRSRGDFFRGCPCHNRRNPQLLQTTRAAGSDGGNHTSAATVARHTCPAQPNETNHPLDTMSLADNATWKAVKPFMNGGLSGMGATCIIQPLDIVKVRLARFGARRPASLARRTRLRAAETRRPPVRTQTRASRPVPPRCLARAGAPGTVDRARADND